MARKSFRDILTGGSGSGGTDGGTAVAKRAAFDKGISTGDVKQKTQAMPVDTLNEDLYNKVSQQYSTEFAGKLSDMRKGYETQYATGAADYATKRTEGTAKYKTQLADIQSQYDLEIAGMKSQWKSDMDVLQGKMDAQDDYMTLSWKDFTAKRDAEKSNMSSQYNTAYNKYVSDLAAQRERQTAAEETAKAGWEEEIAKWTDPDVGAPEGYLWTPDLGTGKETRELISQEGFDLAFKAMGPHGRVLKENYLNKYGAGMYYDYTDYEPLTNADYRDIIAAEKELSRERQLALP